MNLELSMIRRRTGLRQIERLQGRRERYVLRIVMEGLYGCIVITTLGQGGVGWRQKLCQFITERIDCGHVSIYD